MTKHLTIVSMLLLCFFSYSQEWREDTLSLKGKVKLIHYQSILYYEKNEEVWLTEDNYYEYNENRLLVRKNLSNSMAGSNYNSIFREYNTEGNLCLKEYFMYSGDTSSRYIFDYSETGRTKKVTLYDDGKLWSTFYYLYDNDLVTECFVVIQKNNDTIRDIYEYDENSNKIRESHISATEVIIKSWQFDSYGNILQERSELLKAPHTTVFTIESDGSRKKEVLDSNPDDDRSYTIEYSYNKFGQLANKVRSYLDGRIQYDIKYEYNERGDVISEFYLNLDKMTNERIHMSIEYEYDSDGNWIKKLSYFGKKLDQSETREIVYY